MKTLKNLAYEVNQKNTNTGKEISYHIYDLKEFISNVGSESHAFTIVHSSELLSWLNDCYFVFIDNLTSEEHISILKYISDFLDKDEFVLIDENKNLDYEDQLNLSIIDLNSFKVSYDGVEHILTQIHLI